MIAGYIIGEVSIYHRRSSSCIYVYVLVNDLNVGMLQVKLLGEHIRVDFRDMAKLDLFFIIDF